MLPGISFLLKTLSSLIGDLEMDPEGSSKTVLLKFGRAISGSKVDAYVTHMEGVGSSERVRMFPVSTQETEREKAKLMFFYLELKATEAGDAGSEDLQATTGRG